MKCEWGKRLGMAAVLALGLGGCATPGPGEGLSATPATTIPDIITTPDSVNSQIRPDEVLLYVSACKDPSTGEFAPVTIDWSGITVSYYEDPASGRQFIAVLTVQHAMPQAGSSYASLMPPEFHNCTIDPSFYDVYKMVPPNLTGEHYRVEYVHPDPSGRDVQVVIMSTDALVYTREVPLGYVTDRPCVGQVQFAGQHYNQDTQQMEPLTFSAYAPEVPGHDEWGNANFPTAEEWGADIEGFSGSPGVDTNGVCSVFRGYSWSEAQPDIHNHIRAATGGLSSLANAAINTFAQARGLGWVPDNKPPIVLRSADNPPTAEEQAECLRVLDRLVQQACANPDAIQSEICHGTAVSAHAIDAEGDGVVESVMTMQIPPPPKTRGTDNRNCNE